MGYLIKSDVINALEEDMGNAMMCYEGKERKDIVAFCYESIDGTARCSLTGFDVWENRCKG